MRTIVPSAEQKQVALILHALGHPLRVAMVAYILEHPGCICNDLVLRFERAQATISQHLALLREAQIVIATHEGHTTSYCVDGQTLEYLRTALGDLAPHDLP